METKHLIAAAILLMGVLGGTAVASLSQRARDAFFFMIIAMQLYFDRMDVNFYSLEWYRGTTRGFEVSMLDVLALGLLIGSVVLPRYRPRIFWPASLSFMLLFLLMQGISVAMSEPKIFGAFEASKMVRAIIVFLAAAFYVRTERELRILVLGLACTMCVETVYALKQRVILGMDRSPGTFDHPNSLSLYVCSVAPVLVAAFNARFPKWVRFAALTGIGASAMTIMLTVSRAGIPVFALVMIGVTIATMPWKITIKTVGTTLAIVVAGMVAMMLAWNDIKERYLDTTIADEIAENKFENRGQYVGLVKEILKDHISGVGLNNWSYWVSKVYGPRTGTKYEDYDAIPPSIQSSQEMVDINANYAPPAHNLFVITLGEMGWAGLFVFLLLWVRWFSMAARFIWIRSAEPVRRMGTGILFALGGMFLQSQTEWVYRQTTVLLTFYILLGTLASLCYQKSRAKKEVPSPAPVLPPGRVVVRVLPA